MSHIASANAQANLGSTQIGLNKALTRLSSGLRINYAGDDAAGLAVANSYRADIAVTSQGVRNANDGLSSLQIKDGALNNVSTLLDRLATLATRRIRHHTDGARERSRSRRDRHEIDGSDVAGLFPTGFSLFVSTDGSHGGCRLGGISAAPSAWTLRHHDIDAAKAASTKPSPTRS